MSLKTFPDDLKRGVPNNTRWKIFSEFLETHGDDYEQILITDTRDVIFQANVFAAFKDCQNYLGLTTEADDIRGTKTGDKTNYTWLAECFGKSAADKLLDKKIICDGTIIGTTAEMKIFAEKMWQAVSAAERRVNFRIHDQAIANYLVYKNLLPIKNLIEIDVVSGAIFTNALVKDNRVSGDKILRGDGGVPSVVHQYDRHKNLVEQVDRLYRDRNFQIDERFTDTRSVLEQIPCLLYVGKADEAAWFFMKNFVGGAEFGESIGRLLRIWELALRYSLVPAVGYLELAAQSALMSVKGIPAVQLNKACNFLIYSIKNRRAVCPPFVNYIANLLLEIAESSLKENPAQCFLCINLINDLDLPPNKDFYLFVAKANRTFGRKDEALEAYKKALSLT